MTLDDRVKDLERRVGELEGSFGFLSEQTKGVHKSLLSFQAETNKQFASVHERFASVHERLDAQDIQLNSHSVELASIRSELKALPRAVAEIIGK